MAEQEINYTDMANGAAALANMLKGAEHGVEVFRAVLIGEQRLKNLTAELEPLQGQIAQARKELAGLEIKTQEAREKHQVEAGKLAAVEAKIAALKKRIGGDDG